MTPSIPPRTLNLMVGLYGDPLAVEDARAYALKVMDLFGRKSAIHSSEASMPGEPVGLLTEEAVRPTPPWPDEGQLWHAVLPFPSRVEINDKELLSMLIKIGGADDRLVSFAGVYDPSVELGDAFKCLAVYQAKGICCGDWDTDDLKEVQKKGTPGRLPVADFIALGLEMPGVSDSLNKVRTLLRGRLLDDSLQVVAPSSRKPRF